MILSKEWCVKKIIDVKKKHWLPFFYIVAITCTTLKAYGQMIIGRMRRHWIGGKCWVVGVRFSFFRFSDVADFIKKLNKIPVLKPSTKIS